MPIVHTIGIPVTNPMRRRIKPKIITMPPVSVHIFQTDDCVRYVR
jgi:hypothetical protein